MSTEETPNSFSELIDATVGLNATAEIPVFKTEQQLQADWDSDNEFVLTEQLKPALENLDFNGLVNNWRERLGSELPGWSDTQMVVRPFGWLPDSSAQTRQLDQTARIRAVQGYAVLLGNEQFDGVLNEDSGQEAISNVFYSVGMAVEEPTEENNNLMLYHFAAPGLRNTSHQPEALYDLLTQGMYGQTWREKVYQMPDPLRNTALRIGLLRATGQEIPTSLREQDQREQSEDAETIREADRTYAATIAKLESEPFVSSSRKETAAVEHQLLGFPGVVTPLRLGQVIYKSLAWATEEPWRPGAKPAEPNYSPYSRPLIDWEYPLNRILLNEAFDKFLREDPFIQSHLK